MEYHVFNIGTPHTAAWWNELRRRGVITAGYEGEVGDRGDVILRDMEEGDWIIAYCNGKGYVGAGIVGAADTYVLHDEFLAESLSQHLHERGVAWIHAVDDVQQAVSLSDVDQTAPRQTKEREYDAQTAELIIQLLAQRSSNKDTAKCWHVLSAVRAIGRPCSIREIQNWLFLHYPGERNSDARENATLLTVNDANRRHYDRVRKDFRSDQGHARDVLFKTKSGRNVLFEIYHPARHGIWAVVQSDEGQFVTVQLKSSDVERAFAEAQSQVAQIEVNPIDAEEDARVRALRAVVMRQGQGDFRRQLLAAYQGRCAVTNCGVVAILEAAHIRPYNGPETNRVDNGILLRSDIHTLFDLGLLWINANMRIRISQQLKGSEYQLLDGQALRLPQDKNLWPHASHLASHRDAVAFVLD